LQVVVVVEMVAVAEEQVDFVQLLQQLVEAGH
jgi:hypothetical protein